MRVEHTDDVSLEKEGGQPRVDRFVSIAKSTPAEIALVRKIDIYMMVSNENPRWINAFLWLIYFLNLLDRNAMINGKLSGLAKDLNLTGTQYNTFVSILFVG